MCGCYCPSRPRGFVVSAIHAFETWLTEADPALQSGIGPIAAREIIRRVTVLIQDTATDNRNRWKQAHLMWLRQSRLVWLPLNYGLRREQYDTQAEVDSVISALAEREFSDANSIEYLLNEQFHIRLKKTIRDTDAYHVVVIHDFRGRGRGGPTDVIGWDVVVDG